MSAGWRVGRWWWWLAFGCEKWWVRYDKFSEFHLGHKKQSFHPVTLSDKSPTIIKCEPCEYIHILCPSRSRGAVSLRQPSTSWDTSSTSPPPPTLLYIPEVFFALVEHITNTLCDSARVFALYSVEDDDVYIVSSVLTSAPKFISCKYNQAKMSKDIDCTCPLLCVYL